MTETEKNDQLLKDQGAWEKVEGDLNLANDTDANEEKVIHNTSPDDDGEADTVDDEDTVDG